MTAGPAAPVDARWLAAAAAAVARHPRLWPTAARQVRRLARPGWWRRRPFLPVPDPAYLAFRLETQYGSGRAPEPDDVVTYLGWCRDFSAVTSHGGGTGHPRSGGRG